jgi:hypothetical protein
MTGVQAFAFVVVPVVAVLYGWGITLWLDRPDRRPRTPAE